MTEEIERKFLVRGDFKEFAIKSQVIIQGFLSTIPERTVRIRVLDNQGFITVKGIGNSSGTTRFEWEKSIALDDAKRLLDLCEPHIIEKRRYLVPSNTNKYFEVDEFLGVNKGLLIAEIELQDENESFERPDWLGEEVTGEASYYNSSLSKKPFSVW